MLTAIRDRAGGPFAYALVLMFIIPFLFFGIQDYLGGSGPQVAAVVNGTEIPVRAYNQELQAQQRELSRQYGGKLPSDESFESLLRERVIESMVTRELLRTEISAAGYDVSDQAIFNRLRNIEAFHTNGVFDSTRYTNMLAAQRRPQSEFEASLREEIRLAQFLNALQTSVFLPVEAQLTYRRYLDQRRSFDYFIYDPDPDQFLAEITEQDIRAHYEAEMDRYMKPEQVKVQYVDVNESELQSFIEVDDEAIREIYEQSPPEVLNPERRIAAHILLKWDETTSEEDKEELRKLANELVERAREGEDFGELAKEFSEDRLSADQGGSLGEVRRGDLAPEIDRVIFQMTEGSTSRPVETASGLEILHVQKVHPAVPKPFEEVKESLEERYRQRQAENLYVDQTETLLTTSYENPDNLEVSADAIGGKIKTIDWFSRDRGEGLALYPQIRTAAFNEAVLKGDNSDLIDVSEGHVLVLRVAEHRPAEPKPIETVEDEIRQELAKQRAERFARENAEQMVAVLKSGQDIEAVASERGLVVQSAEAATREQEDVDVALLDAVFSASRPNEGERTYGMRSLGGSSFAIFALSKVDDGMVQDIADTDPETLYSDYAARELEAVTGALRVNAEIEILKENL